VTCSVQTMRQCLHAVVFVFDMKQILVAGSLASWLLETEVCTTQVCAIGLACWIAAIASIDSSVL